MSMKTAISLPDSLFERAEELARRLGKSRSQLYREAIEELLLRHSPDAITEALDRTLEEISEVDRFASSAGQHLLHNVDW